MQVDNTNLYKQVKNKYIHKHVIKFMLSMNNNINKFIYGEMK
jgi:intergrase/recombinase